LGIGALESMFCCSFEEEERGEKKTGFSGGA
jgi:hypothetical protein